jgi:hypothetical protein
MALVEYRMLLQRVDPAADRFIARHITKTFHANGDAEAGQEAMRLQRTLNGVFQVVEVRRSE